MSLENILKLLAVNRLGDIVVHSGLATRYIDVFNRVRGQCNDRDRPMGSPLAKANFASGLVAVHLRHVAIHEDEVVTAALPRIDRGAAIGHNVDNVAKFLDDLAGDFLVDEVILATKIRGRALERFIMMACRVTIGCVRRWRCSALNPSTNSRQSMRSR